MPTSEKTFQEERYRIVHQVEQDEKSAIYEAYDTVLKTSVVLKEVRDSSKKSVNSSQPEKHHSNFGDEAKLLTSIKHDHLLSIHDYFSEINNQYLVMELTDGNNLVEAIEKNKKPFSFLEAAKWADQLLEALSYLHKHSPPVIHRCINPQNILLSPSGKIKLLFSGNDQTLRLMSGSKPSNLSNADSEALSLNYLPFEQIWEGLDPASQKVILNSYDDRSVKILERPADARSDIYSLGASLYYMLTGHHPADALARSIDLLDGKPDPLLPPHALSPSTPLEVSNVLLRAMEIRRENRFDSAVIMRQILRSAFVKTSTVEKKPEVMQETVPTPDINPAEQALFEEERRLIELNRLKLEAEQKRLEEERQLIQQKQMELAAAQKQQVETANEQLRQAEERRQQAEQRAAEAEKRLLEKEKKNIDDELFELDDTEILDLNSKRATPIVSKAARTPIEAAFPIAEEATSIKEVAVSKPDRIAAEQNESSGELFAVPQESNKSFKWLAIAAVVLLALGGAGWGIWNSLSPKQTVNSESVASQPAVSNEATVPKPTPEQSPAPIVETTTQTDVEAAPAAEPSLEAPTVNNLSSQKNRPSLPQQARKPVSAPIKPAAVQKKSVTVDDIINDN